ncbi:hypothetical protein F4860DRAFT_527913 [Xylaria cubensis]|nr:hypothetical protein F4860DRAFT_527913 [Xylaria cubensis]
MAPHALPAGMTLSHATQNNNSIVWGVIGLSSGLILILMYLRLCCNRTAKYRTEDYLGLLSLLFFFASVGVLSQIPRRSGFFVHQRDQTEESTEWFLYYYSVSATIQHVTKFLIQMGTFIEFSHIFVATPWKNPTWWVSYALMVVSTIVCLASVLVEVFTCQPRERFWKPSVPGTCVDSAHFNITISSVHLVLDVFVFAIPQAVVWWAKALTRRNKIRVSMAFSVSILSCAWAAGRVQSAVDLRRSGDSNYTYSRFLLWGLAELATSIIVFCVPKVPALVRDAGLPRCLARFSPSKIKDEFSLRVLSPNAGDGSIERLLPPKPARLRGAF